MLVKRGASPNVTEVRVGLLMKAWSPMLSTEFGMATDVILQLLKAYAAILVEELLISMSPEQQAPPWLFLLTHPIVTASAISNFTDSASNAAATVYIKGSDM